MSKILGQLPVDEDDGEKSHLNVGIALLCSELMKLYHPSRRVDKFGGLQSLPPPHKTTTERSTKCIYVERFSGVLPHVLVHLNVSSRDSGNAALFSGRIKLNIIVD